MRIAQSDYDKSGRCPGSSGSGWTWNKKDWCTSPEGVERWKGGPSNYGLYWSLKFRRTNCCNTLVLPYAFVWLNWRTWVPQRVSKGHWWWFPGQRWKQNFSSLWWRIRRNWY